VRGRPDTNAARPLLKLELSLELEVAQASPSQVSSSLPLLNLNSSGLIIKCCL
jgi:hypothetical protein